ncbi:hypothetical protein DNTS_011635 [Danionella cerebrum]|uniref:3',5'-cyclic-GMP phosphodiesterase n=1 Tax=Danionella cerebrum TaxID=2873325 RepID=A0A553NMN9_9TELE|nr:hypothetical protein DNTS_011635 [Danionella translucida]
MDKIISQCYKSRAETDSRQTEPEKQPEANSSEKQKTTREMDAPEPVEKRGGPPKFKARTTRTFKSKAPKPGQKGFGDDIPGMEGLGTDITVVCPWEAFGDMELSDLAKYGILEIISQCYKSRAETDSRQTEPEKQPEANSSEKQKTTRDNGSLKKRSFKAGSGRTSDIGVNLLWLYFRNQPEMDAPEPVEKRGGPPKFKARTTRTFKSKAPKPGQKGFGDDIPGMEGLGTDITVVCPWEAFGDMELSDLAKYGIL